MKNFILSKITLKNYVDKPNHTVRNSSKGHLKDLDGKLNRFVSSVLGEAIVPPGSNNSVSNSWYFKIFKIQPGTNAFVNFKFLEL